MTRRRVVKHYLGIDPGKNGGLCVVDSNGTALECTRMPDGTARIIDWLLHARERYPNLVMIAELAQAMPKQGVTSTFRYARHFATFEVAAILLRTPYVEVRPAVWKKAMGLNQKKTDSIAACRRLFPTVELIPKGCRTEHDGIAEALLIAEWGRRKNL
ncbi:MAG: Holliday junction endonuclease [Deltaproteobacteria bacterium]|nr:MAG: Holliday junction endonuclease [Deltaproteobacteria bacterium]